MYSPVKVGATIAVLDIACPRQFATQRDTKYLALVELTITVTGSLSAKEALKYSYLEGEMEEKWINQTKEK